MNELLKAIETERKKVQPKLLKRQISEKIGKMSSNGGHLWTTIGTNIVRNDTLCKVLKTMNLELVIKNPGVKTYNLTNEALDFYRCINWEQKAQSVGNEELAALIGASTSRGNVWKNIKSNHLKYIDTVKICNRLQLELIIWNPDEKISYLLNNPNQKES
jgi:hypothetical protein